MLVVTYIGMFALAKIKMHGMHCAGNIPHVIAHCSATVLHVWLIFMA
jgi:hypothetical protein